jgi:hypothetical protein
MRLNLSEDNLDQVKTELNQITRTILVLNR